LNEKGDLAPSSDEPPGSDDELWEIAESYVRSGKPDLSFNAFLRLPETSKISDREKQWSKRFVAGFHAAQLEKVGIYGLVATQKAEESINGIATHRITDGYSILADVLQQESQKHGAKYLFDNVVTGIHWDADPVRVETRSQDFKTSYFEGAAVIVTLPIGVLKNSPESPNFVRFSPEIQEKRTTLAKIEMGYARRATLVFKEKWWVELLKNVQPTRTQLGFLFGQNSPIPVWWTNEPSDAAMLTGWVGGPNAIELEKLEDEHFINLAITSLSRIFRVGESMLESELVRGFTYSWQNDPFSAGAYTYMGVGGAAAPIKLAQPLKKRLYFAGEATSEGHWGTVHGAMASGARAAREYLAAD